MSSQISLPRTVLIPAVLAAVLASPRLARGDNTYTVVAAPGVDAARILAVDNALQATGRIAHVVTADDHAHEQLDAANSVAVTAAADAIKSVTGSFSELDYERVVAALERAETEHLAALLATPEGVTALVELNVWLGASLVGAGRNAEGEERYAQVLAMNPGYEMDPDYWAEEYAQAFQVVRARPVPAIGSLTVETNPDGAVIAIDGAARDDATPATIKAAAGWHYVLISKMGHVPWAQRLNVAAGGVKRIPVALQRDDELVASALAAAMSGYSADPASAVRAVVNITGRDDTIVITAEGLVLHDRAGGERSRASGGNARQQVDALFPGVGPTGGAAGKPWYKSTWFLASSAVAIVVAGSLGIYAATRDNDLRGQFVRP